MRSASAGATAASLFFGGGTPSLLRGARDRAPDRRRFARLRPGGRLRDHARSQSRGCSTRSPSTPPPASIAFPSACRRSTMRRSRRSGASTMRPRALRAVEAAAATGQRVSLDLIYAREGQSAEAWRAELARAAGAAGRAPLALPAHHRAADRVRAPRRARPARAARQRCGGGALRSDAGGLRGGRLSRLRNLQSCARARGAGRGTICSIGAATIGSASAPARTGASPMRANASRSKRSGGRRIMSTRCARTASAGSARRA